MAKRSIGRKQTVADRAGGSRVAGSRAGSSRPAGKRVVRTGHSAAKSAVGRPSGGGTLPPLRTNRVSSYGVHPGVAMVQGWIASLKEKSGRTLEEWIRFIRREGPADLKRRGKWLKEQHGLGTVTASWLAERADEGRMGIGEEDPRVYLENAVRYVEEMYPAARAALRPLHDGLIGLARELGPDIRICPCETIVPIYRRHVIAQIRPATRTRIDFGLALGDTPARGALIDTGGFAKKDRITHRIAVSSEADINAELRRWLKAAYDRNAG